MQSVKGKMPCSKGPRRPPSGERDERKTKIIQATADARDQMEVKGRKLYR